MLARGEVNFDAAVVLLNHAAALGEEGADFFDLASHGRDVGSARGFGRLSGAAFDLAVDDGDEFFGVEGFGKVGVCSGVVALDAIACHSSRG